MPAPRTNSPLKTLVLLALLGVASYFAYEYLYVRRILSGGPKAAVVTSEEREQIRDAILARLGNRPCFREVGPMSFRARENQWRVDIIVDTDCGRDVSDMCQDVCEMLSDDFRLTASVWAYDDVGREIAHRVP
jgi:hypothetical protein